MPYLEQSRQQHPDGARMTLTNCLVSDAPAEDIPFLVNPKVELGNPSAVRDQRRRRRAGIQTAARPLDAVIPAAVAQGKTLLFKMDIEGYESRAMTGFAGTLDLVGQAVGFMSSRRNSCVGALSRKNFCAFAATIRHPLYASVRAELVQIRNYTNPASPARWRICRRLVARAKDGGVGPAPAGLEHHQLIWPSRR